MASLQSENERLRSQFYPEPIKEEGIPTNINIHSHHHYNIILSTVEEKPLALIPVKTELKEEAATMTKAEPSSDKAVGMSSHYITSIIHCLSCHCSQPWLAWTCLVWKCVERCLWWCTPLVISQSLGRALAFDSTFKKTVYQLAWSSVP